MIFLPEFVEIKIFNIALKTRNNLDFGLHSKGIQERREDMKIFKNSIKRVFESGRTFVCI